MTMRGSRGRARGVAAVEFALVVPLLLVLVLGAIDWGWYFFARAVVVNASREGARTGTLHPAATAQAQAIAAARTYVDGPLDGSAATITSGPGDTDSIWVNVSYPGGSITGFLSAFLPTTIVARAEMRR